VQTRSIAVDRQTITLPVEDLSGASGAPIIVEQALANMPGVLRVYMNAATEMAYVQYDAERCTVAALREALVCAGFPCGDPIVL
jgi:hypothetical protein